MSPKGDKEGKGSTMGEVVTCEYTINLHKRLYRIGFKYQAPRAVKEIKKFAKKTSFESIPDTNKQIWSQGVRNVSFRVRVRLARLKNQDEDLVLYGTPWSMWPHSRDSRPRTWRRHTD
jgi:large subunit ribosomal protein L31e